VEGLEESQTFVNGGDGVVVLSDLGNEIVVFSFSVGLGISDVSSGVFDV